MSSAAYVAIKQFQRELPAAATVTGRNGTAVTYDIPRFGVEGLGPLNPKHGPGKETGGCTQNPLLVCKAHILDPSGSPYRSVEKEPSSKSYEGAFLKCWQVPLFPCTLNHAPPFHASK